MSETLGVADANAGGTALTVRIGRVRTVPTVGNATADANTFDTATRLSVEFDAANARARASKLYTQAVTANGRQRIAVDQPLAGSSYPFRVQGTTLSTLVADAYLAYPDDACAFKYPFRIGMLYGFGTNTNAVPPGYNAATHDYDVVIVDADDEVVFDSTLLSDDRVLARYWSDRLLVIEWKGDEAVCRIAVFTSRGPNDTQVPFEVYVAPDDAHLDDRVLERLPDRVRSIRVGLDRLRGTDVELRGGYNTDVTVGTQVTSGRRLQTPITVSGSPGDGDGRFSDCEQQLPNIYRVNAVKPDDYGNLALDVTDCYRLEQPHTIENDTATLTPATLQLFNSCGPCSDCDDFVRVYEAVRKLYDRFLSLGARAEAVRDQYAANKARWEEETSCRRNNRLRIAVSTVCPCFVSLAVGYCNSTDDTECLTNLQLRVSFSGGEIVTGGSADCGRTYRTGNVLGSCPPPSISCDEEATKILPYPLGGTWPDHTMDWQQVRPNGMAVGSIQLEFPDCVAGDTVTVALSAYIDGVLAAGPITSTIPLAGPTDGECC